ncbi:MAG: UDP-N-acetylglucosamine 2-epimerase, partial [Thermoplasmata archaeon]
DIEKLKRILNFIIKISANYTVIFPVHPHTRRMLEVTGPVKSLLRENIVLTQTLSYLTFLATLKASRAVVTDSGGVQEEAFVLGKPIITLRKTTEWPETVIAGYNVLLDPER